jgi:hypothetical protein
VSYCEPLWVGFRAKRGKAGSGALGFIRGGQRVIFRRRRAAGDDPGRRYNRVAVRALGICLDRRGRWRFCQYPLGFSWAEVG